MTERPEADRHPAIRLMAREWLLLIALTGLVAASLSVGRLPSVSRPELQVLFVLSLLFIAVRGLELSGLFALVSARMAGDRWVGTKAVLCTFFLSMLVTNDAALVLMVPLTLTLETGGRDRLVILEALAANAGSALTPFGNPQNLFIYWYYRIDPGSFIATMLPLSGVFLVLLVTATLPGRHRTPARGIPPSTTVHRSGFIFLGLLAVVILIILHVLPLYCGLAIIAYAVLFNRASLRIDYGLLLTFLCFFGVAEELKSHLAARQLLPGDTFVVSALASQLMSNVPAALVMAKFTPHWKALLWGTNAGGFGSLIGSLANLIAYRLYLARTRGRDAATFTAKFLGVNFAALLLSAALYYLVGPGG